MPSHKVNSRNKFRNKFNLRSRYNNRKHQQQRKLIHRFTNNKNKDTFNPDDYIEYDYDDERNEHVSSNHKPFNRETSTARLDKIEHTYTESLKSFVDSSKSSNPLFESTQEDHILRPEPLDKSSVEMLRGEYRSYDENVYNFDTKSKDQRNIYDQNYFLSETSSIKYKDFDDVHPEVTYDTISITDFTTPNDTEDIYDDSEKLIIVPSIIDVEERKDTAKTKAVDEEFTHFNIDFDVNPYIESLSGSSSTQYPKVEDVKTTTVGLKETSTGEGANYYSTPNIYPEQSSTSNYDTTLSKKKEVFVDDEFDIVEDIEQLKHIEEKIVSQTIKELKDTMKEFPPKEKSNSNMNASNLTSNINISIVRDKILNTDNVTEYFTGNSNLSSSEYYENLYTSSTPIITVTEEPELFDSLNSDIINELFSLVKMDVEVQLPILLNDQNYHVDFTNENFEKVIMEIHKDPILKREFKEYLRKLINKQRSIDYSKASTEESDVNITESIHSFSHYMHAKKKELTDETKQYIKVYQKIMLLSGFIQQDASDSGSGDNDEYDVASLLDREMGDEPAPDGNLDSKNMEEELKKKNKIAIDEEKETDDKSIKTYNTPSGKVKILFYVNEKEVTEKDKNNVNVDSESNSSQNKSKFLHESEKHKVSAIVTSDGKIGILVKSKPKDQVTDTESSNEKAQIAPKLAPTKMSEGSDFSVKTTVLRPIAGTEGVTRSDKTILKPVGTNVWTAIRKDNVKKTTAKALNIGDIPYDDEYYDEDDSKGDKDTDQIDPLNINTELPIETTTIRRDRILKDNRDNKLNHNKSNENDISNNTSTVDSERNKNFIRTFDEDFLKGFQKNTSDEKKERKPEFSGIKNYNSIDYRKSHDKSVYSNILDILGPDSKDVIQLLKDVKHINNERTNKKQLDFGNKEPINDGDKKVNNTTTNKGNVPILNRNPAEAPTINVGMSDLDERILRKDNDDIILDPFKERERNRVDFHLNKPVNNGKETEKDWNDDETNTKNLEDIWSDNDDELAEDSMVKIIPVHTGHSIFQKINLNKIKPDHFDNLAGTTPTYRDIIKEKTTYTAINEYQNTNNASRNFQTLKYRLAMCIFVIFSFSFYTAFFMIRIQTRYNDNVLYIHW